ncbi:hypothetical protein CYMTET_13639 [Cymbomonas tetramitiformis]|uniref:Uncharacterized protein n=1 Tax=Cymbomonas tetramitiformis TaxID=36881 RepID=A0AAE0GHZ9_9CHLO|nr:hypothetical protein CYMTET_13639 [Cymbomonas tetramitiformis]
MIGYYRKSHKSLNFTDCKKNGTPEIGQKDDDLCLVLDEGDLTGRREFTENTFKAKADMIHRFKMKRDFPSFKSTVLRMIRFGRYFVSTRFVIESRGLSEPRSESLRHTIILPKNAAVEQDIVNVLFPYETAEVAAAADRRPSGIGFYDGDHDDADDDGPVTMTDGPVTVGTPAAKDVAPVQFQTPPESSA